MKRIIYLVFSLFLLISIGVISTRPVYASSPDTGYSKGWSNDQINSAFHISNVQYNIYSDFIRRILGPVPGITTTETALNSPTNQEMLQQSAVFSLTKQIIAMYVTPPASTYAFVQDLGQTLGFIPHVAYAQGIGFSGLSPLLPIWKIFRNIAYFILALVMVVIGFMVMFRKKIDPKTVVTVQNALPKIVISLLLITFSYAIVGILIDLMYVLIALVGALFMKSGLLPNTGSYLSGDLGANIFGTIPESQILWRILGINDLNFWGTLALNAGIPITGLYLTTLIAPFSSFLGLLVLVVGLTPVLIWFVIAIAMFFLFLRLLIFFVGTYIKILIALIFGPFILLTEALPGGKGFESWFKGLVGNLLIFPASTIMFMLSGVFINLSNTKSTIWAPPYSSIINNTTSIGTVVGLGILFMIPTIGKQITDMFKVKSSMDVGAAGAALAQAVTSPFGTLIQGVSLGANIKMLGGDQLYGKFKSVAQKERK